MERTACTFMKHVSSKKNVQNLVVPMLIPSKVHSYLYHLEGGNILEDMIKGYMMQHQNPFANKKKSKKPSQKAEIKE